MVDFVTNNNLPVDMTEKDTFELQQFLPYLLNQAAEAASMSFQTHYKQRYGMLRTEWRVLFHLGVYGPLTATEIGQRARIHKTKISRAVAALEERRFLTRARSVHDRRQEMLELTAAGRAAYADLLKVAEDHDRALVADLSVAEAASLRRLLARIAWPDRA
jgi:DNA-binding MarR family transcriptional regulator